MPGEGFAEKGEEQLWAQRIKLYIYTRKVKQWVSLGTGKGAIVQAKPNEAEFVFEEEKLRIPTARHLLATATPLRCQSASDRGFSWTATDQIQNQKQEYTWFTIKFAEPHAAQDFKAVFDRLVPQDEEEDLHGSLQLPDKPLELPSPASAPPADVSVRVHEADAQQVTPVFGAGVVGALVSPPTSAPASPVIPARGLRAIAATAAGSEPPKFAWLLYFEKGVFLKGGSVREASTSYVGTYDSKPAALQNAVRAMDAHSDPSNPWRQKDLWTRREDCRKRVGDKGTVIAVHNADGVYFQTKIRKVPLNQDLQEGEGDANDLWG